MSRRNEIREHILANVRAIHPHARISDEDLDALINERLEYEDGVMETARDSLSSSGFNRVTIKFEREERR